MIRSVLTAAVLFCLMLGSPVIAGRAFAQAPLDTAAARSLFEQGVELASQSDWANAADRFERSNALRPSPVVAFNLAAAWIELGRLVEASELLRQVERDDSAKPALRKKVRAQLKQLEPRIATLVVTLESSPPPDEVRVNDRALPDAAIGVPTPVDPGAIEISVVDGGSVLWTRRIEVLPGGQRRITISLPPKKPVEAPPLETEAQTEAQSEPAAASVPTPSETAAASEQPAPSTGGNPHTQARDEDGSVWQSPWLWAGAGAVVVAGVVVAVIVASAGGDTTEQPIEGSLPPGRITVPE